VRVNVVSRTGSQDPKVMDDPNMAQGVFENKENRLAPGGVDGYRRRVLTATVRPRNVGARGV
jgi:hypothetical protein